MDDFFTEQLVKRKNGMREHLFEAFLILLAVLSVVSVLYIPYLWGILVPVAVIVAVYFLFRRQSVEFEYQVVNGDMDIDRILYKTRRKHVFSTNINELEYMAPEDHFGLKEYHPNKVMDFSSHADASTVYAMIVSQGNEQIEVLIEPDQKILDRFYMMAPRKVIR